MIQLAHTLVICAVVRHRRLIRTPLGPAFFSSSSRLTVLCQTPDRPMQQTTGRPAAVWRRSVLPSKDCTRFHSQQETRLRTSGHHCARPTWCGCGGPPNILASRIGIEPFSGLGYAPGSFDSMDPSYPSFSFSTSLSTSRVSST